MTSMLDQYRAAFLAQQLAQYTRNVVGREAISMAQAASVVELMALATDAAEMMPAACPGVQLGVFIDEQPCEDVRVWLPLGGWESRAALAEMVAFLTSPAHTLALLLEEGDSEVLDLVAALPAGQLPPATTWRITDSYLTPDVGPDIDIDRLWALYQSDCLTPA